MASTEPVESLCRDRSFVLFLLARSVGVAGYAVSAVAMPLLVLQLTDSALLTSAVVALEVVPYLLLGLIAGAVADRVDRRRLIVTCQLLAALLLATIPAAQAAGVLSPWHVLAVATGVATCWVWFDAATFGVLPSLVGRASLVQANSYVFTAATLTDVIVPAGAGLLIAGVGAAYTLGVDAAGYVLAAAMLAVIPGRFQSTQRPTADKGPTATGLVRSLGHDIVEGLRFLWRHDVIRPLVLVGAGNSLSTGALTGVLIVLATRQYGLTEADPRVGLLWTALAVGALAGALLLPRLTSRLPLGWVTIGSLTASPALMLALALTTSLTAGLVLLAAFQVAVTITVLNGISARQILTPDHLESRVNTTARMIAWGGTPFGALLAGGVAEVTSIRLALIISSGFVLLAACGAWASALRHRDTATAV